MHRIKNAKKISARLQGLSATGTVLLLAITGCSHAPAFQEYPPTASSADEVQKFEQDLVAARNAQVDVLSPDNYRRAFYDLNDAKDHQKDPKDSKTVLHEVAEGRAYLNRANEFAKVTQANMEDVVTARQAAITSGANTFYKSEFEDLDDRVKSVGKDVEHNDVSSAADKRKDLQAEYLALELQAIKHNNLAEAQGLIEKAKKEGAKDYAPRSLAIAEKKVADTDAFINANRHDTVSLPTRAADARNNADHLLKITRDAKNNKSVSSEDLALKIEDEQNQVTARDSQLSVKDQQLQQGQQALSAQQETTGVLAMQKRSLEEEKAFNKKYEEARAQFNDSEAEVYKQGDKLVIRLKGLDFPSNQANLRPSSFKLLSKVETVIKEFDAPSILVEGHTDAVGGKARNDKLSEARAKAVSQYLVSNSAIEEAKISTIGYGYQKPIASNKTAAGKAQNRRVDIVITPERSATGSNTQKSDQT